VLLKFIPIRLTAALILGIVLGKYANITIYIPLILIAFGLAYLGIIHKQKKHYSNYTFEILSLLLVVALGTLVINLHQPKYQPNHYSTLQEKVPETYTVKIITILRPGSYNNRYLARLMAVSDGALQGKLLIHSPDSIQLQLDDELIIWTPWKLIKPPLNPGQFNYAQYMADKEVYARADLKSTNFIRLPNPAKTWRGRIGLLREHLSRKIEILPLEDDTKDIMQAMLLGQRTNIDASLYTGYKDAGAVHLLAISGLHVGILVLILKFIFSPLRRFPRGQNLQFACIVLFLWGYAALAGFTPSVVRAVTMFSFVTYALVINRSGNSYNVIALSLFFILLILDPLYLFHAGFQMSYGAVLAIIYLYPKLTGLWRPKHKFPDFLWQLFTVSISAQVGVLPISLYYFHQFPGLFFISNILIVPLLGLVLGMGFLILGLSLLEITPFILIEFYNEVIICINTLIQWIAQQEMFIFRNIPFDDFQVFLTYTIILLLIALIELRKSRLIWIMGCVILISQGWTIGQKVQMKNRSELILYHQIAQTLLVEENCGHAIAYLQNIKDTYSTSMLQTAAVQNRIKNIEIYPLKNSYMWKGKHILLIDKSGIQPGFQQAVDFIILTDNPRINLKRVLDTYPLARIIADGSNYAHLTDKWRATCYKVKRPFHYTGEKGAFYFE